jgi:hypothetical protein
VLKGKGDTYFIVSVRRWKDEHELEMVQVFVLITRAQSGIVETVDWESVSVQPLDDSVLLIGRNA